MASAGASLPAGSWRGFFPSTSEPLAPGSFGAATWIRWNLARSRALFLTCPMWGLQQSMGEALDSQHATALCLQTYLCLRHGSGFQFLRGFPSPGYSRCHSSCLFSPSAFLLFFTVLPPPASPYLFSKLLLFSSVPGIGAGQSDQSHTPWVSRGLLGDMAE